MRKITFLLLFVASVCSGADLAELEVPGHWVPDENVRNEAIELFYASANEKLGHLNWPEYRIQYAGVWEHEEQYIHFIAICSKLWFLAQEWDTKWVALSETSPCYFQATYSIANQVVEFHAGTEK